MSTIKFLDTVSKPAAIFPVSLSLGQKVCQDLWLELLQYRIKFHPAQFKSVSENEANRFCFSLTLWPPSKINVSESSIKWQKSMVPISMAGVNKFGWKICMYCPTFKFLQRRYGWTAGRMDTTWYKDPYDTHLDQKTPHLLHKLF